MRLVYTLFFFMATAVPAIADRYLSQTEIEAMLARSGATPESAGMKQLRVCRLTGDAKNSNTHQNQSSIGQAASKEVYQLLQRYAAEYQVTKPQWNWRVVCAAEWQLITPGFTRLVGGERRLEGLLVQTVVPKPTTAVSDIADAVEVRIRFDDQIYVIRGENLRAWNACKTFRFGESAPAVRKKDCK